MEINDIRRAILYHEAVGKFYSAVGFECKEHVNYQGDVVHLTPCYFCSEVADFHHFCPALSIFDEWMEKQQFRLLEQARLTVCPVCAACLEKLNKSVSLSLDDQAAFINSIRNGTFNPIFHAGNS